jgi:hypothetical protein
VKVLKSPCAVGILLVTDVGADWLQLKTNWGDRIAPCPKMFSREVALSSRKLPGDGDRTRAFEISAHRGDSLRGRYLNTEVSMVRHQVPCNDPTCFLPSQLMQDGPEGLTNRPKQGFPTPLGYEDYMILAIPPGRGQALIGFRHGVLLGWAHQATQGELYSWHAQRCSSHTGQTSGLPQILSYASVVFGHNSPSGSGRPRNIVGDQSKKSCRGSKPSGRLPGSRSSSVVWSCGGSAWPHALRHF